MNHAAKMRRGGMIIRCAGILGLALAVGCVPTHRARSVEGSGFLKNYGQLTPGGDDQAVLTYTNPRTNFRKYTKIILDPVRVVAGEDSKLNKMDPKDLQNLVNYFDATLRQNLSGPMKIVNEPGPGVMRLRVALTDAQGAAVVRDTISSILPIGIAINALTFMAVGSGTALGEASAEFEAVDSQTGERLAAAVDKRVGAKYTGEFDKFEKWRTAKAACDYWAERAATRLAELQGRQPTPKE